WALPPDHRPIPLRARMGAGNSVGFFSGWIPILTDQFGSSAHPGENRVDSIKEPNSIPHLWGVVLSDSRSLQFTFQPG
ncbi:MAG TPA: hypothetical protein PLB32_26925, partial [Acidobacteriota bacterium]|nr:hypothetical protein [Acidobacteriota bacterium]